MWLDGQSRENLSDIDIIVGGVLPVTPELPAWRDACGIRRRWCGIGAYPSEFAAKLHCNQARRRDRHDTVGGFAALNLLIEQILDLDRG